MGKGPRYRTRYASLPTVCRIHPLGSPPTASETLGSPCQVGEDLDCVQNACLVGGTQTGAILAHPHRALAKVFGFKYLGRSSFSLLCEFAVKQCNQGLTISRRLDVGAMYDISRPQCLAV